MLHIRIAALLGLVLLAAGCGVPKETLMPTPAVYAGADGVDPFADLHANDRGTTLQVFYATERRPKRGAKPVAYGNDISSELHLGTAAVRFAPEEMEWEDLADASRTPARETRVWLELDQTHELAALAEAHGDHERPAPTPAQRGFVEAMERTIHHVEDPEILLYVHGAKVNFYNACVFAAEVDHFTGRDMVAVAYSWPTHQDIFRYAFGEDIGRAKHTAKALATFIEFLADNTDARRINMLGYSAGGRVTALALEELRQRHPDATHAELQQRFRIGTVVLAASDEPLSEFLRILPDLHDVSERLVVNLSDADHVLATQALVAGDRVGLRGREIDEMEIHLAERLGNIELVDVSAAKDERGFDIGTHHYWFRHPWASSDVMLNLRTRRPAAERGLEATDHPAVWALPADYPERAREAARKVMDDR